MPLDAVIFDYGNTLVSTMLDWQRIVPRSLEDLRQALSPALPGLDGERLGRDFLFLRAWGKRRARERWLETRATSSLRQALALQGLSLEDEALLEAGVAAFFSAEAQAYPLIPGMPELLDSLKATGVKLGLLSNATSGRLVRKALAERGMLASFDQVLISEELGICKPDPALFKVLLQSLDVPVQSCAMVGDLVETDVAGAKACGMRAILVDFLDQGTPIPASGPQPEALARSPGQLQALLEAWREDLL